MFLSKAEMARRMRESSTQPPADHGIADSKRIATMSVQKKRRNESQAPTDLSDVKGESSPHHDSSAMGSNKKAYVAKAANTDISSWSDLVADFNRKLQKLIKLDSDQNQKMKIELQLFREKNTCLEATLGEMMRDRDDALAKPQRTMEDYARHRKEHEVANRAWESTEAMLHNKINTLDTTLETAKNEIAHAFVNGFK